MGCVKRTMHYRLWCVSRTLQFFHNLRAFGQCVPKLCLGTRSKVNIMSEGGKTTISITAPTKS